ncbi:MAG: hypothetical protein KDB53_05205, partial [Planctomycetes bacterium]|nr:hypothetical protein [Planctomycetota bacterium]
MFTVTDARPVPGSEDYAIILVNWNGGGLTRRALSGVGSVQPAPWCVYVVDNGSQDGSADDLES